MRIFERIAPRLVHRFARVSRLALAGLLLLPFLAGADAASCDVRLNEFMAGPSRDWNGDGLFSARDDEWVELIDTGTSDMDLSLFLVSDGDSTFRWGGSGTIHAGEHLCLFGSDAVTWEHDHGRGTVGFSLANAGDKVILWQVEGADTVVIDSYAYKPHEGASDRAVGRLPDGTGAWSLYDGLDLYTGTLDPRGNGCNPSPRLANACTNSPTGAATWGRMKAAYR